MHMYKQKKMCNNAQKSSFFPICKLPLASFRRSVQMQYIR